MDIPLFNFQRDIFSKFQCYRGVITVDFGGNSPIYVLDAPASDAASMFTTFNISTIPNSTPLFGRSRRQVGLSGGVNRDGSFFYWLGENGNQLVESYTNIPVRPSFFEFTFRDFVFYR